MIYRVYFTNRPTAYYITSADNCEDAVRQAKVNEKAGRLSHTRRPSPPVLKVERVVKGNVVLMRSFRGR